VVRIRQTTGIVSEKTSKSWERINDGQVTGMITSVDGEMENIYRRPVLS